MSTQLVKAEDYGLEPSKGMEMTKGLNVTLKERDLLIEAYNDVLQLEITEDNIEEFKTLRLLIRDNRTKGINVWHKTNKEFFLSGGRFVDAIKNKENAVNEQMESKLLEAEKHFENLEKERVSKINNERIELVRPYLEEVDNLFLADMEEDVFDAYLLTKKQNHEAILKAEQEREAKRIAEEKAEAERLEAQRLENIKLKAEADAKEKALEKERAEAKAKQNAIELKAKKELETIQAKADAERKAQAEKEAKLKAELKAKEDAEIKRIAENNARIIAEKKAEDERLQAELSKGDADKVKDLLSDLEALKTKYEFKSVKNKKIYADTCVLIDKVINHIKI